MYTLEDGGGVEAVHSFDTLKQPKQAKSRTQKAYNFWLGRAAKMYRPEKYEQKNRSHMSKHRFKIKTQVDTPLRLPAILTTQTN